MTDEKSGETTHRRVPAVTRAVGLLRRLGAAAEPVGVNQLARDLALVPSTCLHILRVLVDEGLVAFDPHSKRYSIDVGILPIALGLGAGGESRAPLGVAIVGGMLFSTLLTLFIVPAAYILVDRIATTGVARLRAVGRGASSGSVAEGVAEGAGEGAGTSPGGSTR